MRSYDRLDVLPDVGKNLFAFSFDSRPESLPTFSASTPSLPSSPLVGRSHRFRFSGPIFLSPTLDLLYGRLLD